MSLDLTNVSSQKPQALPDGKYVANITDVNMADTKAGNPMVKLTFTVSDGPMKNRKVFDQYVLEHSNPKVVEISLGKIKSILECSGYKDPNKLSDIQDLSGLQLGIKTKTRADESYGDKTEISYFFKPTETVAPKTAEILPF